MNSFRTFYKLSKFWIFDNFSTHPIEKYTNVPRNKTLQGSNDKQYMSRRMQNRKENSVHNSDDNFRVSEDRLSRIANWHHLPR